VVVGWVSKSGEEGHERKEKKGGDSDGRGMKWAILVKSSEDRKRNNLQQGRASQPPAGKRTSKRKQE